MRIVSPVNSRFIDPQGRNRVEVARILEQAIDRILTFAASAAFRDPLPRRSRALRAKCFAQAGRPAKEILSDLDRILSQAMNAANLGYVAHMDTLPSTMSIIGEAAVAMLNNNMLSEELSPVFTRMETELMATFSKLFGLGKSSGGFLLSGGTLSNLQALTVARNRKFDCLDAGVLSLRGRPVIFASQDAHTSILKAAMVLGLGTKSVTHVDVDAQSRMIPEDLERKIRSARKRGETPFCVVATAGTTVTGSVDPIAEIAAVAERNDLWLHVDAAYGGALIFSPRRKGLVTGIERADSITFNPQKWMYVTKACSMVLFADFQAARNAFKIDLPYMANGDNVTNFGEFSVQGTRHVDALKLWLTIEHFGTQEFGRLVDRGCDLAQYAAKKIKSRLKLELACEPQTNIICFRGANSNMPKGWEEAIRRKLLREDQIYLSLPDYRGSRWLRAVFLNPFTERDVIDRILTRVEPADAGLGTSRHITQARIGA